MKIQELNRNINIQWYFMKAITPFLATNLYFFLLLMTKCDLEELPAFLEANNQEVLKINGFYCSIILVQ